MLTGAFQSGRVEEACGPCRSLGRKRKPHGASKGAQRLVGKSRDLLHLLITSLYVLPWPLPFSQEVGCGCELRANISQYPPPKRHSYCGGWGRQIRSESCNGPHGVSVRQPHRWPPQPHPQPPSPGMHTPMRTRKAHTHTTVTPLPMSCDSSVTCPLSSCKCYESVSLLLDASRWPGRGYFCGFPSLRHFPHPLGARPPGGRLPGTLPASSSSCSGGRSAFSWHL